MTVVDVSQLQDRSLVMEKKAYLDKLDRAEINPERQKTLEAAVPEREKSTLRGVWDACQCCNLRFQWQQLVRLRSSKK